MDSIEAEENIYAVSDAKLHGAMCKSLSIIVYKILGILPLLEDARPGRTSGLQALCSLYVAIDKAKSTLQHCSECSKLYLAITADFVLTKFGKVRCALEESLRRIEDMVPQDVGSQIMEIVGELEVTVFTVDQSEKQVGDELIALLQKEKRLNSTSNDEEELEIFRRAAIKLGITSSRAALTERRALKRLIERARAEQDERKESAVAYLLHLMRKYSKLLRNEMNDMDSQCSTPCSPLLLGSIDEVRGNVQLVERQISKFGSMKFGQNGVEPGNTPAPPEQLRCPISMHLMYDPVIISSGQTYERVYIEKWFRDGHNICPKTRQQVSHLGLTPNYCIKGLVVDWCEQNGVPAPDGPPESLDLNYWRLALSVRETSFSRLMGSFSLSQTKGALVVPIEESDDVEKLKAVQSAATSDNGTCKLDEMGKVEKYESLMDALAEAKTVEDQRKTVERIRFLLRDDEDARIYMGTDGFVAALVQFLRSTVEEGDEQAQETAAMALFNLAVNNNKNKEKFLAAGLISLLEQMIKEPTMHEASAALYLNLSCLDEAKPIIGSSKAVPFLFQILQSGSCKKTCKHDALFTIYNLSTHPANIDALLHGGIISCLHAFLTVPTGSVCNNIWSEKALAILMNLAACPPGKSEIVSTDGLISAIANILESGEPLQQEQAASCFLSICEADDNCSQLVLQEGVIPALVCMSINGTSKGRERAHRLLTLFREQRQRDSQPVQEQLQQLHRIASEFVASGDGGGGGGSAPNAKPLSKARSRRLGRALNSMWKLRNTVRHFR